MNELEDFYVHTVIVETYQGTNGYGEDLFAAPVTLDPDDISVRPGGNGCFVDDTRSLVRTATGEQVVSETTVYTYPEHGALFTADSRVTIDGVVSRVIRTNVNTSGNLELPDHAVISLT
ncbi:hypothetical protein [Microbacterium sp. 22242]|uniref:hypothetical protein n=1 Tax=Microbacterium sp. 22242 TaxID=3453896 RepID=UPI003F83F74F